MSRIGEKIKFIRTEKGLSAKKLAQKLGVSEKFINEVESGRKIMNEMLMDKVSKILGKDLNDINMYTEESGNQDIVSKKFTPTKKSNTTKTSEVWDNALSSIFKVVPIYDYSLNKIHSTRKLPIINNKVEGYPQDKVVFLKIEDDDMIGFRISSGDIAFGHKISEIENNIICLVEYNGERTVRQVKRLDSNKALLISNRGSIRTETVDIKRLKVLVKIDKVEILL